MKIKLFVGLFVIGLMAGSNDSFNVGKIYIIGFIVGFNDVIGLYIEFNDDIIYVRCFV